MLMTFNLVINYDYSGLLPNQTVESEVLGSMRIQMSNVARAVAGDVLKSQRRHKCVRDHYSQSIITLTATENQLLYILRFYYIYTTYNTHDKDLVIERRLN